MTGRRAPVKQVRVAVSATPAWPPTCGQCGATGEPGPDWTPYAACRGRDDQGRPDYASHQRTPVGART